MLNSLCVNDYFKFNVLKHISLSHICLEIFYILVKEYCSVNDTRASNF